MGRSRTLRRARPRSARRASPRAMASRCWCHQSPRRGGKGVTLGILGGGAWGSALAQIASDGGEEIVLWAREPDVVATINERHENPAYLPGIPMNRSIRA